VARAYDAAHIAAQYEAVLLAAAARAIPPENAGERWVPSQFCAAHNPASSAR
jgi:hypothetical protein